MNNGFVDLKVYQLAYRLAMEIYQFSKSFPKEEKYSLTDQIRRSSRSVCANLAEAYRKRIYPKHFVSKLTDSDGEATETFVWLNFAKDCNYIDNDIYRKMINGYNEVGRMLGFMIKNPEKFQPRNNQENKK